MYRITKEFHFEAAHRLLGLPDDHPCGRLHGHSYRVEVVIECPCLDERGFCQVDYRDLDPFGEWIKLSLDHATILNAIDPLVDHAWPGQPKRHVLVGNPTAENLARYLFEKAKEVTPYATAVRVSETRKTWAEYRP